MKLKLYISVLLSVFVSVSAYTQIDRSERPEPGPAPEINIPVADEFELPNGLKVIVVENDKLPRVSYNLRLVNDPVLEKENKGYASLAGQMLRNGTHNMSKEEIDEAIDFIGANVTTHSRGFFATSLSRHNEDLLKILSDITINPSFPEQEFEKLRSRSISNIASQKGSADYMMGLLNKKLVYGEDHPYGESETEETLSNITVEHCKDYYQSYFKPNVAYLIIVGDVKTKKVKRLIKKYFGDWESGDVPQHDYEEARPPQQRKVAVIDRPEAAQTSLKVAYPIEHKPNDKDRIAASVMNTLLGGGFFRLNENLREEHGYTYGAYSSLNRDNLISSFSISTEVGTEVTDSAVQQVINEMYRLVHEPVDENE
ncbi:MAG: pitrilysin family protein, partial [Bacteroidales bacterium]